MANQQTLEELYAIIKGRKETPKEGSYTNYLFDRGLDKILKKVGEEATEVVIAAKNEDPQELVLSLIHISIKWILILNWDVSYNVPMVHISIFPLALRWIISLVLKVTFKTFLIAMVH